MDMLRPEGPRLRDGPLYAALALVWLLLSFLAFAVVLHEDWERVKTDFHDHAGHETTAMRGRLRSNEAVLDGLAAFLGTLGRPSDEQLSFFAGHLARSHPQIYMIEVVQRVPDGERPDFERALAKRTGGDGRISRFDYQAGRTWGPVPRKPHYYPISFIWPQTPEAMPVLGLDMGSVPHLRDTMHAADRRGKAVSSPPFALVEGPWAYVMIKPASGMRGDRDDEAAHRLYAMIVVKAESLRPDRIESDSSAELRVVRPGEGVSQALLEIPAGEPISEWEARWLPVVTSEATEASTSQAIVLRLTRQMRWSDISVDLMGRIAFLSFGAFALAGFYVRRHYGLALRQREDHARAVYGALHDALTGLPNRSLLLDRVRQALAQWTRKQEPFALFFIDLDGFKAVNDRYGHEAGDAVLREVARRLKDGVREVDTAARIAGDEFVVLVSGPSTRTALAALADKLLAAVAQPMRLPCGTEAVVTASLGIGTCPDDGEDVDTLLNAADREMYRHKRQA